MTPMYTITISVLGTDGATSLHRDLKSTLQSVEDALVDKVVPGLAVQWEIRCPSGRTAVGGLTVNAADSDGRAEIAEHVEMVRDVLTEEARDELRA